jgi:fructose/tagatose bisphosphate aldolase
MPPVSFQQLMAGAQQGRYAVGYFECWNLESLLAVADAAEAMRSPVLLGVSGIYLPHPERRTREHLGDYAALGLAVCSRLTVPACLVFNESPHLDWVMEAIQLGFGLVMYTGETSAPEKLTAQVKCVTQKAHAAHAAVEAEIMALPGVAGSLDVMPPHLLMTDVEEARKFVEQTGIDALAVNVGQVHLHGRQAVNLNLEHLAKLRANLGVPLVLHGATSVVRHDLAQAIHLGVCKINVGSALKQSYLNALRAACAELGADYNPYEVMGSGLEKDVLTGARLALQKTVEDWMLLLGSARQA